MEKSSSRNLESHKNLITNAMCVMQSVNEPLRNKKVKWKSSLCDVTEGIDTALRFVTTISHLKQGAANIELNAAVCQTTDVGFLQPEKCF